LDLPEVRKALGVSPKVGKYYGCSRSVGEDFASHADGVRYTAPYIEGLLERGIKVLIYVGTYDWIW
jgi:cathepsin A (carboxypeptidase C)